MAYQVNAALLNRLPRTFVPALNEQFRNWDLLFPAERRTISTQMEWLAALPDADFKALFEPIVTLERQMNLPPWNPATDRLSVTDTGILVRSPHYQQWRAQVERTFEKIDAGVEAQGKLKRSNKLIVAVMPAGLASHPGLLWPKLESEGKWVSLEAPFGNVLPVLYRSVAEREQGSEIEPLERTWVLEYDQILSATNVSAPVVGLSFDQLGPVRHEFLKRLNYVKRDLPTLDLTYDDLRRLDLQPLFPEPAPVGVREFTRNLFLSGNGALLFGNSFVQWGASEAFRRAAPQATFCRFGVRPKLKPFSSVVLFEDQNRANPVKDQPDPEGSLIDTQLLMEYIYLSAQRGAEYASRMLVLVAVPEQKRVLVLGPATATTSLTTSASPIVAAALLDAARSWLAAKGA
ncbi:MAG: hypothetical protein WBW33_13995 [Bryobacteraceae bacterium]